MLSYEYLIDLYSTDYDDILDKFNTKSPIDLSNYIPNKLVCNVDAFDSIYGCACNHMNEIIYRLLYGTKGNERDYSCYFNDTLAKSLYTYLNDISTVYIDLLYSLMNEIKDFYSSLLFERDGEDIFLDITGGVSHIASKFENKIYDDFLFLLS